MKPKVVASECCAGLHPQNTLHGFQFCLESGVDGIEFDVHLSRDAHVVVQHDYCLNKRITRDPSGQWLASTGPALCDLTFAELRQFDVGRYLPGSHESESYPDYEPVDGERIPTLEQLLDAYASAGCQAELWIELKTTPFERGISSAPQDLLTAVLKLVEAFGLVSKTILLAFEWQLLVDARRLCPGIGRDFLTINPEFVKHLYRNKGGVRPEEMYLPFDPGCFGGSFPKAIAAAGGEWWGPHIADVTPEDIYLAHELGVMVNVWGVDSNDEAIEQALLLEADAITLSDSTMLQRRLKLPPQDLPDHR
jgi:glycerophosphoryl diester phosphodiesterase